MISGIKAPDTQLAREAEEFVQSSSSAMLYNHVMRCYWFAELFARKENSKADRELMFFSATLHDVIEYLKEHKADVGIDDDDIEVDVNKHLK